MDVEFVTSAANLAQRPAEVLPEFAFVGRSNVGKSSLINVFLARKSMAKTSGRPGKTQLLNYFLVAGSYYLVDLPGYGYAKVGKSQRAGLSKMIRSYVLSTDRPKAVFLLVDIRHKPSLQDLQMVNWLREAELPFAIVPTKIDKIGKNQLREQYQLIAQSLGLGQDTPFFPTSAQRREGAGDMHAWVGALLEAAAEADRD